MYIELAILAIRGGCWQVGVRRNSLPDSYLSVVALHVNLSFGVPGASELQTVTSLIFFFSFLFGNNFRVCLRVCTSRTRNGLHTLHRVKPFCVRLVRCIVAISLKVQGYDSPSL